MLVAGGAAFRAGRESASSTARSRHRGAQNAQTVMDADGEPNEKLGDKACAEVYVRCSAPWCWVPPHYGRRL